MEINCKRFALKVLDEVKDSLKKEKDKPKVAILMIGNNKASKKYIHNKIKRFEYVGIEYILYDFDEPKDYSEKKKIQFKVADLIYNLNARKDVTGIFLQLPLPNIFSELDKQYLIELIDPRKDVDGITNYNKSRLYVNPDSQDIVIPCTARGIYELILDFYGEDLSNQRVILLGRSWLVNRPLARLLENKNATVITIHSQSFEINQERDTFIERIKPDILVSAVGKKEFMEIPLELNQCMCIDVGINVDENNEIKGDLIYENKQFILHTPVPNGVGQLTTAFLCKNISDLFYQSKRYKNVNKS